MVLVRDFERWEMGPGELVSRRLRVECVPLLLVILFGVSYMMALLHPVMMLVAFMWDD